MNKYILYTIFRVFVIAVTTYKTVENLEIGIPEEVKDKPISKQLANISSKKKKKKKKFPFYYPSCSATTDTRNQINYLALSFFLIILFIGIIIIIL